MATIIDMYGRRFPFRFVDIFSGHQRAPLGNWIFAVSLPFQKSILWLNSGELTKQWRIMFNNFLTQQSFRFGCVLQFWLVKFVKSAIPHAKWGARQEKNEHFRNAHTWKVQTRWWWCTFARTLSLVWLAKRGVIRSSIACWLLTEKSTLFQSSVWLARSSLSNGTGESAAFVLLWSLYLSLCLRVRVSHR